MIALKHQHGFTLPEMLITLAVLSIFILLAAPLSMDRLHEEQEKQFLKTLQSDLLLAQTLSTTNRKDNYYIYMSEQANEYVLIKNTGTLFERSIPENWIDKDHSIIFEKSGVVRQPASFILRTPNRKLKIVFPFGKGRARVEEI